MQKIYLKKGVNAHIKYLKKGAKNVLKHLKHKLTLFSVTWYNLKK